ncbi:putative disease resistance protein RPP13-like [Capsicum annuum]|nr:putative disease resistance protein RPP13-like [Capsicum annuum]
MEKYKVLYLQRFLKRQEGLDLESCINESEELKEEALKCYNDIEDLKKDMSHTDQFLQMLLLDGCFVGDTNTNPTYSWRILRCNRLQIIWSKEKKNDKGNKMNKVIIPNATELSEAGLSFKNFGNIYRSLDKDDIGDTSLFDIKYENGLLKIPCLRIFDSTESNLRNLIGFEQQSDVHHRYFSDYATFMH